MIRHNKQHDARAATLKRIAKKLREAARESLPESSEVLKVIAHAMDDEAKVLREMR